MKQDARNTLRKTSASWLQLRSTRADPVAMLASALGVDWHIEQQADCMGEKSIIALPSSDDDETLPTYILYEKHGQAHVGILRNDKWESDRSFGTVAQAVAAIIAEATTLSINPRSQNL